MAKRLDTLRQTITQLSGKLDNLSEELEAAQQRYAEALWQQLKVSSHPVERLTLYRVVDFFLEQEGPQPTEVIADFLRRVGWPTKVGVRFVSAVGTQLRQRSDLFSYDKNKRVWHRKSG